jgi:hypothetical protein
LSVLRPSPPLDIHQFGVLGLTCGRRWTRQRRPAREEIHRLKDSLMMQTAAERCASTARRSTAGSIAALALAAFAVGEPASAQQLGTIRFDNWLYFQENVNDSERWQYRPRFFIPFDLPRGWTFTQRLDLPVYYTNNTGPENPGGGWKSGIGDWFIEEAFTSPEVSQNLRLFGSVRFVFPTGGGAPFGSNQYQWAPAISAVYVIPEHKIAISPTARYFMSVHATEPGAAKVRKLDLYPTVTFGLPDAWSLAFYPENPISYNDVIHKWFVPIDVMLIKRLSKTVEFGFGGAYGLVKDDPQYQYIINGRLTFYF